MTSRDATEGHLDRADGGHGVAPDVDQVALALRWVIGRSPQTDEEADRRLLREIAARLAPETEPTPAALDARLAAILAEMAATDELVDHAEPRHRPWITPVAHVYFGDPEDLPEDLRGRIGSETVLRHLGDGVSNRARAAARILGVAEGAVRVRREPALLRAAAAALLARADRIERIERVARAEPPPEPSMHAGERHDPAPPAPAVEPASRRVRWVVAAAVAAVLVALVALVAVVGTDDDDPEEAAERPPASSPRERPIPAVPRPPTVLGIGDGTLVAVAAGATTGLDLDDVVEVDAHREGDVVHVVARLTSDHLVYGAVGSAPGRWVDLGRGFRAAEVAVDRTGEPVVVAVSGADGDLARTAIGDPDAPVEWHPLAATGAVDIDMATNHDGRLEVGGLTTTGTAFNIWQTGAPGGWSNYSDPRAGEDGRRIQAVSNLDGRLELFVEREDGTLWNTWQEAPGRSWRTGWDPRYFEGVRQWRVVVGPEGRLVAVALTDEGVRLRRQIPVPQADGTTKLMWPPSTVIEELDPLDGAEPDAVTAVAADDGVLVVASGAGRTVGIPVGLDGPGPARPLAATGVDALVPVDG